MSMNNRGSALIFVMLLAFVMAAIVGVNVFIAGLRAEAARATVIRSELETKAKAAGHLLRGHIVTGLKKEVAAVLERTIQTDADYYLHGREATLASALQEVADRLYCSELPDMPGVKLAVAFTDHACGEPLPPEIPTPTRPYLIEGLPNSGRSGARVYHAQSYALPFSAFVTAERGDKRARALLSGTFIAPMGPDDYRQFSLYVVKPPTSEAVAISANERHEGPMMIPGPPVFTGNPKLHGRLFVHHNPEGKATFGTITVREREMVPSPQEPCYPEACPAITGGVDWSTGFTPGLTVHSPSPSIKIDQDVRDMKLRYDGNYTHIALKLADGTKVRYRYRGSTLEKSTDGGSTWTAVSSSFNGVVKVEGTIYSLRAEDPYQPALAGKLFIYATGDLHLSGPLSYNTPPCVRVEGQDGVSYSQCDPTIEDNLTLQAGRDLFIDMPPGGNWEVTAHLLAPNGAIRVPKTISPPGRLRILGTFAANYWSNWGYDDTSTGRRVQGVILDHYFDSRYYYGRSLGFALGSFGFMPRVGIYGVIPKVEEPHIVRQ